MNLAATWKKWRQNLEFYLTAMMKGKNEEDEYTMFLFLMQKQDIFNIMDWDKKQDAQANQTEEDETYLLRLF